MYNGRKQVLLFLICGLLIFTLSACGAEANGNSEMPSETQQTQETEETESEFYIEIADATEILTKTWDMYAVEDRFAVMGGHFESAVLDAPAKYDLTQTTDLIQMYCVPEAQLQAIDDAATMIDFYNAGRFTATAFHVINIEGVQDTAAGIKTQVMENQWHGETPEKVLIMQIDEQYVVTVYGRTLSDHDKYCDRRNNFLKNFGKKVIMHIGGGCQIEGPLFF